MELAIFVYLANVLGSLSTGLAFVMGALLVLGSIALFAMAVTGFDDCDTDVVKPWVKTYLWVLTLSFMGACLIPGKSTMYQMAGAYAAQTVVQSATADKVLAIINANLDEQLEKLQKPSKGQ